MEKFEYANAEFILEGWQIYLWFRNRKNVQIKIQHSQSR
jgi:hypothetical protein